jgi:hypothetical protein
MEDLIKKIAKLESVNDQLASEIRFLDEVAKKLGFQEGLKTLKEAAIELLEQEKMFGDIDETYPAD